LARPPRVVRFLEHPHGPDLSGLAGMLEHVAVQAGMVVALFAALLLLIQLVRLWTERRVARAGLLFELRLPAEFDRERFAQVLRSLPAALNGGLARRWIGFELQGVEGRVRPLVFAAGVSEQRLRRLIGEALPGSRLDPVSNEPLTTSAGSRVRCVSLAGWAQDRAPLETSFRSDPVGLLLRSAGETHLGEKLRVQLLVAGAPRRARGRLLADASRLRTGQRRRSALGVVGATVAFVLQGLWEVFDPAASPSSPRSTVPQVTPLARERAGALMEKAREPLFACSLRFAAAAPSRRIARGLLEGVQADYRQYDGAFNRPRRVAEPLHRRRMVGRLLPRRPPLLLSASELAALCPFPELPAEAPVGLRQPPARELAPTPAAASAGIRLGVSEAHGRQQPVFVSPRSLLQHAHLLGGTGSGKSTALLNLAVESIAQGLGCLVIEPKGDLVAEVVKRVPPRRRGEVILLDFGNPDFAPAFNLLAGGRGQGEAVASIFNRLFGGNWGPRSDDLLRAATLTLEGGSVDGGVPTLAEVLPILEDPRRRRRYRVTDTVVLQGFWRTWDGLSVGLRQQALAPLANKLRALLLRPAVRDALVQPEAPDFRDAIASGKIILCSLPTSHELMGADGAALFGSVLLHWLWQAAQALGPSTARSPFVCLVDEAQRFTALPGGVDELLSQARGYGLGFVLAHQNLVQLSPELREAVAVNCRSKLCFQLDPPDNERMARHFEPALTAGDLLHLDRFQLACRIIEDGLVLPPLTATATPPPPDATDDVANLIRLQTRLTTRSKQEVEALIAERFPELEQPPQGRVTLDGDGAPAGTIGGTPDVPPDVPHLPRSSADNSADNSGPGNPDSPLPYDDDADEGRPWAA
jgi:hypothetical protein